MHKYNNIYKDGRPKKDNDFEVAIKILSRTISDSIDEQIKNEIIETYKEKGKLNESE